jgi:hypothetical protein
MSRRDGRLPKSIAESMSTMHKLLDSNDGYLSSLAKLPENSPPGTPLPTHHVIGTGIDVIKYKNLSYSGNFLLYIYVEEF